MHLLLLISWTILFILFLFFFLVYYLWLESLPDQFLTLRMAGEEHFLKRLLEELGLIKPL